MRGRRDTWDRTRPQNVPTFLLSIQLKLGLSSEINLVKMKSFKIVPNGTLASFKTFNLALDDDDVVNLISKVWSVSDGWALRQLGSKSKPQKCKLYSVGGFYQTEKKTPTEMHVALRISQSSCTWQDLAEPGCI